MGREKKESESSSGLIGKNVKVVFEDGGSTRTFEGILREIATSHFAVFTNGRLQAIPSRRVIRIEIMQK
jgi:hypothetical protein